jgi:hypothetical protein
MAGGFSLEVTGFKKLKEKLRPRSFEKRLKREVKKATRRVGLLAERKIKTDIRQKKVKPSKLSGMTIAIKGSTKALVNSGQLLQSITSKVIAWDIVVVGVLKNKKVRDEATGAVKDVIMIARILHDGATIPVTPKMRRYFFWLANADESPVQGKISPLSMSTRVIRVPARPFMKGVLDKTARKLYQKVWQGAVNKALAGKT